MSNNFLLAKCYTAVPLLQFIIRISLMYNSGKLVVLKKSGTMRDLSCSAILVLFCLFVVADMVQDQVGQ